MARLPAKCNRTALTLPETLIAGAVIGILLVAVSLGLSTMRTDLKRVRTIELLAILNEALSAYHSETQAWPSIDESAGTPKAGKDRTADSAAGSSSARDDSGDSVIAILQQVPASRQVLERLPPLVRLPAGSDSTWSPTTVPAGAGWTIRDAWGLPLRCLTAGSRAPVDREAVAAGGGRPIFVSAGEDGDMGQTDRAAAADNLRSNDRQPLQQ